MNDLLGAEYFLVFSDARADSTTGLQPKVACATAGQIIARAESELSMMGIPVKSRSVEEALKFSMEHLAKDRLFHAFGVNERDSEGEFLYCAEDNGISEEIAERLLFRWHQARRDSLASN